MDNGFSCVQGGAAAGEKLSIFLLGEGKGEGTPSKGRKTHPGVEQVPSNGPKPQGGGVKVGGGRTTKSDRVRRKSTKIPFKLGLRENEH